MKIFKITLFVLLSIVLSKCTNKVKKAEKEDVQQEISSFVEREFAYPIPTSYEITELLKKANAGFVYNITNSPKNVDKYLLDWQKALNLGIYGADMSYASTYDRQEETLQFLSAARQLVEDLNITTAFNEQMVEKLEDNINNKDELIMIITESIYNTYNHLNSNGQEIQSLLVVAGSVIEGLFITGQLIVGSDYDLSLLEIFSEQKGQVFKLLELMEKFKDDENINRVLPKLRYINSFFEQLGEDSTITEGQFNDVIGSINEMRSTIVQ